LVFEHTEGVLLRNRDIHRIHTIALRPALWTHLKLIARLFRRYDIALTAQMGDRPTLYAWLAGRFRIGMQDGSDKQRWKQKLLSRWTHFNHDGIHTVLNGLGLVDVLGIPRQQEVQVGWHEEDGRAVQKQLPFDMATQRYAVLHLYPKFPYKMWRREQWLELAQWLAQQGLCIVLTGSNAADELAYIEPIHAAMPDGTVNMAGKLTLAENAFLISRAQYYIGPDTALTHMAAALGVPTVALFGPSNPVTWGPWPKGYTQNGNPWQPRGSQRVNNVALLQGAGDCVPCVQEGCDRHQNSLSACLQELPAAQVVAALREFDNRR
jgi:heptosyltransferase-3